jgi:O-antigen ligase
LNKLIYTCFYLGLFFFAFNSFEGLKFLGEFQDEAGIYFFFTGFVLLLFEKKFYIPFNNQVFKAILLFLGWCFVATLLNLPGVLASYFKHTPGIVRFIRQYFSLTISAIIIFLFFYNVLRRMTLENIFYKVRKTFLWSLIFAFILGFFETLYSVFGIGTARIPIEILNYFPFVEKDIFVDRISSIGNEPPLLAIFLISICGWMFSYIHTNTGITKYIPTIIVFFLTFFSGSRTALVVVVFQFLVFFICIIPRRELIVRAQIFFSVIFFVVMSVFVFKGDKIVKAVGEKLESLDFKGNLTKSISNQSRFGMQYATLQVFKDNPIAGVGFGQQTYYSRHYYPGWATKNNYEFAQLYRNTAVRQFPPAYNLYTRILAETGIIGFLILLYIIVHSLSAIKIMVKKSDGNKFILSLILLTTLSGLYLNWLQIDSFKIYCVWFSLAIFIRLKQEKHEANQSENT